jgi:hypothetical protein
MVDQPKRDIDVFAEISEDEGSECEDVRVIRADQAPQTAPQRPARPTD